MYFDVLNACIWLTDSLEVIYKEVWSCMMCNGKNSLINLFRDTVVGEFPCWLVLVVWFFSVLRMQFDLICSGRTKLQA